MTKAITALELVTRSRNEDEEYQKKLEFGSDDEQKDGDQSEKKDEDKKEADGAGDEPAKSNLLAEEPTGEEGEKKEGEEESKK